MVVNLGSLCAARKVSWIPDFAGMTGTDVSWMEGAGTAAKPLQGRPAAQQVLDPEGSKQHRGRSPGWASEKQKGAAVSRSALLLRVIGWSGYSPEPNTRYFSLPTKPNLVTPEPLMICSTLAERS